MDKKVKLRNILVDVALQWQASFGIAPSITSSISESLELRMGQVNLDII